MDTHSRALRDPRSLGCRQQRRLASELRTASTCQKVAPAAAKAHQLASSAPMYTANGGHSPQAQSLQRAAGTSRGGMAVKLDNVHFGYAGAARIMLGRAVRQLNRDGQSSIWYATSAPSWCADSRATLVVLALGQGPEAKNWTTQHHKHQAGGLY